VSGFLFWLLAIKWVRLAEPETAWLGWIVMALSLSLGWPLFLGLARLAVRTFRWPILLAVPTTWVALEYLRAFYFTGFPWYYLAHSQYLILPLIQVSDLTGSLGVSFVVAMTNACLAEMLAGPVAPRGRVFGPLRLGRPQMKSLAVVAVALLATLVYGLLRISFSSGHFRLGPRVALIQSNVPQVFKMSLDAQQLAALSARYTAMVRKAAEQAERPDLIVWPETSYPYQYVRLEPRLDQEEFERQIHQLRTDGTVERWLRKRQAILDDLHGLTDQVGIPMLIGSILYDFTLQGVARYNSAVLLRPGLEPVETYEKIHLVPFGEYVPLIKSLPWLVRLTPFQNGESVPSLAFGKAPRWFDLNGWRLAVAICFEDTLPNLVRRFFCDAPEGHQPDLLLNISNDGWFQGSEELEMHLAISVFRAIENRVPLARAVNTGRTALIDGNGHVDDSMPKDKEGVLSGVVLLDDRVGPYSYLGDWLGQVCVAAALAILAWRTGQQIVRRRRPPRAGSLPQVS
jgi:apolipoprotein N-acyltransferase